MPSEIPAVPASLRRFVDASAIPLTLTASDLPDHPLVLVNRAFEILSGYAAEEIIGQNCRFLQGGLENGEARARIREALASGSEAEVVLRNCTKDGRRFDNLLFLQPIVGDGSRYFLGSQFELQGAPTGPLVAERLDALDALDPATFGMVAESRQGQREGREAIARSIADYAREQMARP